MEGDTGQLLEGLRVGLVWSGPAQVLPWMPCLASDFLRTFEGRARSKGGGYRGDLAMPVFCSF